MMPGVSLEKVCKLADILAEREGKVYYVVKICQGFDIVEKTESYKYKAIPKRRHPADVEL